MRCQATVAEDIDERKVSAVHPHQIPMDLAFLCVLCAFAVKISFWEITKMSGSREVGANG